MLHISQIATLCLALTSVANWTDRSDPVRSKSYTVELIDEPRLAPHCGYIAFESAMLFKVVLNETLSSDGDSVVIVFRCPGDFGPDFFQRERQYQVELEDAAPDTGFDWLTFDAYEGLKLRTFWATSCKPRFFSGPR